MTRQTMLQVKKESQPLQTGSLFRRQAAQAPVEEHDTAPLPVGFGRDYSHIPFRPPQPPPPMASVSCPFSPQRCPFGGACHACPPKIQAKLKIGQPGDQYEQEADRVAETVMRMPEPQVQRKCSAPGCKDEDDEKKLLQTKPANAGEVGAQVDHPLIQSVLSSPGQPLDAGTRSFMEPRFGQDFSGVRVHTGGEAAESARAVNARAYTVGRDVVFGEGQYAPGSDEGKRLVAHELVHVAQQNEILSFGDAPIGLQAKSDESDAAAPAANPTATVLDYFVRNKEMLTEKHNTAIEKLAFSIWNNLFRYTDAKATVAISGHTDTTGTEKYNSGLAGKRAANVKDALEAALQKQGVDPAKFSIATTSYGESRLLVPTTDEVDEPRNRRVEIEVTILVKPLPPSPKATPSMRQPLPGMPGGPPIWTVPGILEGIEKSHPPIRSSIPKSEGEWLEDALKRDPLLNKLPEWARKKAISALKDADEKAADAILDALPIDDEYKKAAKAAMKALLQTLKGRKFKPPPEGPPGLPDLPPPSFPKAPGETIFKLPAIPLSF